MSNGIITRVSGPLIVAEKMHNARMYDVVRVGEAGLVGEIIELKGDTASIQVYEDTAGVGPGEEIIMTGHPLSVELGPGLIESIFDGIQRPLDRIMDICGDFIEKGIEVPPLDRTKKWKFTPLVKSGDHVSGGDIIGTVVETPLVEHRIMLSPETDGSVAEINEGEFTVTDTVCTVKTARGIEEIPMMQVWPVRTPRPVRKKIQPFEPMITGQRVIDSLFPVAKGGTACIPGPFGSGKTVVQHQLAKWADAKIVVYIGCGERGNEMTDVLMEFPELLDPSTGEPLMKRTVLIANTSNMPVAAREASVYTGITIAEYFRDMGYPVALMADSTSRWAEAMREISGRLEEMPGEEGYPAYLSSKVAEFYERAGRVICMGSDNREGSLTAIGAVSPAGGDLSDPVVQATLRVVKVFWSLEDKLAFQRHFPAISWLRSYSLYDDTIDQFLEENIHHEYPSLKKSFMQILEKEAELEEIVRLVGIDSLSSTDRVSMKIARIIREDFLHQNAFHETDSFTDIRSQFMIMKIITACHAKLTQAVKDGAQFSVFEKLESEKTLADLKYRKSISEEETNEVIETINEEINRMVQT